ncbi:MAG: AMP-binding protein [Tetrasphaera sp.]
MGVPTFYTRLLDDPRLDARSHGKHAAFRVRLGAAAWPRRTAEWQARTGHAILERYGMTETNMNTSNPYAGDRVAGTVGLPLPGVEVIVTRSRSRGRAARRARSA